MVLRGVVVLLAGVACESQQAIAQVATQVRYAYDAAGNLVGITRGPDTSRADLAITGISVGRLGRNADGSYSIPVDYVVTNVGDSPASPTWYDRGYLSSDGLLQDADPSLAGFVTRSSSLAAGASYAASTVFVTSASTAPGAYYLIVKVDGGAAASGQYGPTGSNAVPERSESNNIAVVPVSLPATFQPDLVVTEASLGALSVAQSGAYAIPVTYTVVNAGGATAQPNWYDLAYLSADAKLDDGDQNLTGFNYRTTTLAAGASYTVTKTFTTTAGVAPGTYTLFVKPDGRGPAIGSGRNTDSGALAEGDEANNAFAIALTLPARPDLRVSEATVGALVANQNGSYGIPVTYTVINAGGLAAQPNWYDLAYLSADATLNDGDQNLTGFNYRTTALAAGTSYTVTKTFATTASAVPGSYTLFLKPDGRGSAIGSGKNTDNGAVTESDEANNPFAIALTLPGRPDLRVTSATIGTVAKNASGAYGISVTYTVTNAGGLAAQPNWYDLAYLSADATLDDGDQDLAGFNYRTTALSAGASYTVTKTFTTSASTLPGSYTLFVKPDGRGATIGSGTHLDGGAVSESDETNNTYAIAVRLP